MLTVSMRLGFSEDGSSYVVRSFAQDPSVIAAATTLGMGDLTTMARDYSSFVVDPLGLISQTFVSVQTDGGPAIKIRLELLGDLTQWAVDEYGAESVFRVYD